MKRKRNSKGRFVKGGGTARKRKRSSSPRRRRRAAVAVASNPRRRRRRTRAASAPRRRRRRAIAANPRRRTRRARRARRGYRRNPSSTGMTVGKWLGAGAIAVATTLVTGVVTQFVPKSLQEMPILYGGLVAAVGVGTGIGLTSMGYPAIAVGIGIPLVTFGGFLMYVGVASRLLAPAPAPAPAVASNPRARFRDLHQGAQQRLGPGMGALASYTPAGDMGRVFSGSGIGAVYPAMSAIEATVGDFSQRPNSYVRVGEQIGAR